MRKSGEQVTSSHRKRDVVPFHGHKVLQKSKWKYLSGNIGTICRPGILSRRLLRVFEQLSWACLDIIQESGDKSGKRCTV